MSARLKLRLLTTTLGVLAAPVCAVADPVVAPDPQDSAYPTTRLDDLVVTARRRQESVQDVPIAISVLSSQTLDRTGTTTVGQLTQIAPSVQLLSSNPRNTAITIRGIGASYGLANDGLEQGVGIYVDQIYYARPATATLDFIDLDRIEVLRGPQGTLFGKNTTAGVLNITTLAPTFTPSARTEFTVGDYGFVQGKATVSGPLIQDRLAGRLSVVSTRRDGFIENVLTGRDQNELHGLGVRGQLLFRASDSLTVQLFGDFNRQDVECCTQVYYAYGPTLKPAGQQFPALAAGRNYRPPSTNPYDRLADVDAPVQADQTQQGLSAIVEQDLGWASLTSVTGWREWEWDPANDRDYTSLDIIRQSANPSEQSQFSQEFRLTSPGGETIDWTVGVYYFEQTIETTGVTEYGRDATYWLIGGGLPDALLDGYAIFNHSKIDTQSYAAFGQLTWTLGERLHITPGLRYTSEEKDGFYRTTVQGGSVTTNPTHISRRLGIARPQFYEAAVSDSSLSGQLSVAYDLTGDVNVYAAFASGYKSGGINMAGIPTTASGDPALTSAVVKPEKVTTYEIGLKSQWFDRRATVNLAAYWTEIQDFQANVVDAGPGALRGYLANVERVEIRGVELDTRAHPNDAVDLYANLAWTDGEYASFANGPCPLERIGASTAACDLSGADLPGVSRWAASAGGEVHGRVGSSGWAGEAYAGADASYRSAYVSDASASRYAEIDGYALLNLRAGFRSDAGWEAFVFVKNVLDEDYMQFLSVQTGNSGLILGSPGDPRTVGLTLRARY